MSVDAYSGLPFQAGQAVATAIGRAAMAGLSLYMRAPLRNTATIALVTLSALAGSNALYSQTARHPAPLFGTFDTSAPKKAATREAPQPLPVVAHQAETAKSALPLVTDEPAAQVQAPAPAPNAVSNDDVRAIQEKLTAFGFYSGKADGLFGPKTSKSIRQFQEMLGQSPTGQLTAEIVASIKDAPVPAKATAVAPAPAPAALSVETTATATQTANPVTTAQASLPPPAPLAATTEKAETVLVKPSPTETAPATTTAAATQTSQEPVAITAPASSAATNVDLVKSVQRGLSSLGFLRTEINGVADEATARAVRNFEVYYNYAVSGRVTNELVNLLVQNGAVI